MKFNEKKVVVLLLFGLLLINVFSVFVLAADTGADKQVDRSGVGGKLFGWINDFLGLDNTWGKVIMGIIVFVMLLAAFYDILTLVSIFNTNWVIWVLAAGLAIAASLVGIITKIVFMMFTLVAGLGAVAVVVELIVVFVIFIFLSFGAKWAQRFAVRRHNLRTEIAATKGAGDAVAAVKGLKMISKELGKGNK
jgi:hypothetical protein